MLSCPDRQHLLHIVPKRPLVHPMNRRQITKACNYGPSDRKVVGSGYSLLSEIAVNEQGEDWAVAHFPPSTIHKGSAIDQCIKLLGTASLELCRIYD
jgi:hypothetical protein